MEEGASEESSADDDDGWLEVGAACLANMNMNSRATLQKTQIKTFAYT